LQKPWRQAGSLQPRQFSRATCAAVESCGSF
jgi:hypothetical protein